MTVKFNQYWSVYFDKIKDYEKFMIKKYIPGMNKLGIHVVAGWSVLVGGSGDLFLEGVTNDLEHLEKGLRSPKYKELNHELQNFIHSYKTRVLVSTGREDHYSKDVMANTIKFNQVWNVISKTKEAYEEYVVETFYPCLEELGIRVLLPEGRPWASARPSHSPAVAASADSRDRGVFGRPRAVSAAGPPG